MITREQALALCRHDPAAAAHLLQQMSEELDQLKAELTSLTSEYEKIKQQVAKNSRNSSKPPSSDGYSKPVPKNRRKSGQRKSGGQKGHRGHTLQMVDNADHSERHEVLTCENCGRYVGGQASDSLEKRQVFDIPEPKLEVTEHQAEVKTCCCGHVNHAAFPEGVNAPVQYGPRIKGTAVYLRDYHLLPSARLTEMMADLFGANTFSEGTLANISGDCFEKLAPVDELLRGQAVQAPVAGFDETGLRSEGKLHWLHTVSTDTLTWYFAHPKRGTVAMDAAGVLPEFAGRAVHDFWDSYLKYGCLHAFCNAHLLRELTFLWEEEEQYWAADMIDHLLEIKDSVDTAREKVAHALSPDTLAQFQSRYFQIVLDGYDENPLPSKPSGKRRRGRRKQSKARNLLDRFYHYAGEILAFMYDFSVPFDNNLAERDLRMAKVKQKISGTFRTTDGLTAFCRIRSYVSTARKNGLSALHALSRVFEGTPFMPLPAAAET